MVKKRQDGKKVHFEEHNLLGKTKRTVGKKYWYSYEELETQRWDEVWHVGGAVAAFDPINPYEQSMQRYSSRDEVIYDQEVMVDDQQEVIDLVNRLEVVLNNIE